MIRFTIIDHLNFHYYKLRVTEYFCIYDKLNVFCDVILKYCNHVKAFEQ